jgi:hypothetical protein
MTTITESTEAITKTAEENALTPSSRHLIDIHSELKALTAEHKGSEPSESVQLDTLSSHSIDVVKTFGVDSYGTLNSYATAMEDVLKEMTTTHKRLVAEVKRNHQIVDDLRDYCYTLREDFATVKETVANEDWDKLKDIIRALGI